MRRKQRRLAWLFLTLSLGMLTAAFFAAPAAPLNSTQASIVALSEDENADINKGFFRAAAETSEEGTRSDDFVLLYSLQGYHSNNFQVSATQVNDILNLRSQKVCRYLLNSCLTI